MDLLTIATCALFVQPQCHATPVAPHAGVGTWQPEIEQAATNFGLPPAWVRAVMARESGGRTTLGGQPIRSSAGAMGLMQLMPKTYGDLRRQYGFGANPDAPGDNIAAGAAYLRQMYIRYGYPNMFAAYNAGPGRFDDFLLRGRPLPDETVRYVGAIVPGAAVSFGHGGGARISAGRSALMSAPSAKNGGLFVHPAAPSAADSGGRNGLFVALSGPRL
jgi:D-alanyl-D-alanine carboxypeptidase